MFLVELNEAATAEALIAKDLVCQKYGMIFKVEEFRALDQEMLPLSRFRTLGTKLQKATCCLICGEGHSHKEGTTTCSVIRRLPLL